MLHLNVPSSTDFITLSSCTSALSPTIEKDAELNRQFPFDIDLNKIFPVRTKAEKANILYFSHRHIK